MTRMDQRPRRLPLGRDGLWRCNRLPANPARRASQKPPCSHHAPITAFPAAAGVSSQCVVWSSALGLLACSRVSPGQSNMGSWLTGDSKFRHIAWEAGQAIVEHGTVLLLPSLPLIQKLFFVVGATPFLFGVGFQILRGTLGVGDRRFPSTLWRQWRPSDFGVCFNINVEFLPSSYSLWLR